MDYCLNITRAQLKKKWKDSDKNLETIHVLSQKVENKKKHYLCETQTNKITKSPICKSSARSIPPARLTVKKDLRLSVFYTISPDLLIYKGFQQKTSLTRSTITYHGQDVSSDTQMTEKQLALRAQAETLTVLAEECTPLHPGKPGPSWWNTEVTWPGG